MYYQPSLKHKANNRRTSVTCAMRTDLIHPQLMTPLEASAYITLTLSFAIRSIYLSTDTLTHTHTHSTHNPHTQHNICKKRKKETHTHNQRMTYIERTQPQNKKFNLPDDIRSTFRPQISQHISFICFAPTFTLPCFIVLALSSFPSVSLTSRSA